MRNRTKWILSLIITGAGLMASSSALAAAKTAAEIVAGRFVATPENPALIWYVHPKLQTREQVTDWAGIARVSEKSSATVTLKEFTQIPADAAAATSNQAFTDKMKGRILLDVSTGTQWYVSPRDGKRYPLRNAASVLTMLKNAKLGISQKNLDKIPLAGDVSQDNLTFRKKMRGRVLWNVQDGTYWFVSPKTLTRYPLETEADAEALRVDQYLGVTASKLNSIAQYSDTQKVNSKTIRKYSGLFIRQPLEPAQLWYVSPKTKKRMLVTEAEAAAFIQSQIVSITAKGLAEIRLVGEADYEERTVTTERGTFAVKVLTSDLGLPGLEILTLGGDLDTCETACLTFSVGQYAAEAGAAIAAINGGYFCPGNAASCADKTDSYYGPLYHSTARTMINQDQVASSPYPMLAWDTRNRLQYYPQAALFGSPEDFVLAHGASVRAAIANWPALVENGVNVIDQQLLDSGQRNTKTTRVALAVQGTHVKFIVAESATVIDLASVVVAVGADYAINLDGGSSTGLWRYGQYLHGPGRTVPNAIVIRRTS